MKRLLSFFAALAFSASVFGQILPGILGGSAAAGGDPYWSYVTLLTGNDSQSNGSTSWLDQSSSPRTITGAGNAAYTTGLYPTGLTSSIAFDGTGDWITSAANAAFNMGSGSYVWEVWFARTNTFTTNDGVIGRGTAGSTADCLTLQVGASGELKWFSCIYNGAVSPIVSTTTTAWTLNTFYHIAVSRSGDTHNIYVNGTREATATASYNDTGGGAFWSGRAWYDATRDTPVDVASIRITKGSDRGYTGASITVPTLPLSTN